MADGEDADTIRLSHWSQDRLAIEARLTEALANGPLVQPEESASFNFAAVRQQSERLPPDQARALLRRKADSCANWLRAVEFGAAAGDSDPIGLQKELRDGLVWLATTATVHGLRAGEPVEQLLAEAVHAASLLTPDNDSRGFLAAVLSSCYEALGRPELALSVVVRAPVPAGPGEHLLRVLDVARRAVAAGHREHLAWLLSSDDWPGDPTGLHRALLFDLVSGSVPSHAELAARDAARRAAFDARDFVHLKELALFDVMWLESDAQLWLALAAVLKLNGAVEQAELARQAALELGLDSGAR